MFKEENWKFDTNGMLRAVMKSNSGGDDYKLSLFPFALADVLAKIDKAKESGETPDYQQLATEVVRGDIAPFCNCPNFIYQNAGPRGENKQLLNPSGSKVKSNFGLCKHLLFPVQTFPFIQSMFAKRLKDGFFKKDEVLRQYNDGRTRAFLNEGLVIEEGRWLLLENEDFIKASILNEGLAFTKQYEVTRCRSGRDDRVTGVKTFKDWLEYFKSTLENGKRCEVGKGRYKISLNPVNMDKLISNVNCSLMNATHTGYSDTYYKFKEAANVNEVPAEGSKMESLNEGEKADVTGEIQKFFKDKNDLIDSHLESIRDALDDLEDKSYAAWGKDKAPMFLWEFVKDFNKLHNVIHAEFCKELDKMCSSGSTEISK
jgi:hypothetical protein